MTGPPASGAAVEAPGRLIHNAFALYLLQALAYISPLLTVPYLVRVLQPEAWGRVTIAQSFAQVLMLCIEYGFQLSATRDLAQNQNCRKYRGQILAEVTGAKVLILAAAVLIVLVVGPWLPLPRSQPALLWSAVLWAAGQGFSLTWYYQGLERLRPLVIIDVSARLVSTVCILTLIRKPEDGWKVLAFEGFASVVACMISFRWATRYCTDLRWPSAAGVAARIWSGVHTFSYRAALSLYSVGNPLVLGWFAPARTVGFFAAADRIARAFVALVHPLTQALYPRMNFLARIDHRAAAAMARAGLLLSTALGTTIGVSVYFLASSLVSVLLGASFSESVPVMRILALLSPLIAVNTVLGLGWLLPRRLDHFLNVLTWLAGILNLTLAVNWGTRNGAVGMAWAVVCTETFVLCAFFAVIRWQKKHTPGSL